jgi:hypothetical protein
MIEEGLGFQLVPRQPAFEQRIGQRITGVQRSDGGIGWGRQKARAGAIGDGWSPSYPP